MKKKIFIIAFTVFIIFFTYKAKAATFIDNQVVPADKIWTIRFNDAIALDLALYSDINITDSSGSKVELSIIPGNDSNSIQVKPVSGKYKVGEKYILNIDSKVHSLKNKNINNPIVMHFSIQNNLVNYKVGDTIDIPDTSKEGKVIDIKQADVDGDSQKEDVVLAAYSPEEGGIAYKNACLMIVNPASGECKEYKQFNEETVKDLTALYLEDYEGKGRPDIRVNINCGGNYCNETDMIFSCENGELNQLELPQLDLKKLPFSYKLQDDYSLRVTLPFFSSFNSYIIDLSKDEMWVNNLGESKNSIGLGNGPWYEDGENEEGEKTLKMNLSISGSCHADQVAQITTTYMYSKSQNKFVEINEEVKSDYPCYQIISEGEATIVDRQ